MRSEQGRRLEGKIVLLTGGTRGIGEAITRLFAAEDADVAFCGRDRARGELIAGEVQELGGRAQFDVCDVTSERDVERWVDDVVARHGRLDIVVNNAAIGLNGPFESTSLEDWEHLLLTNVTSMFLVCRATIPWLRTAGGGAILNLGSMYGVVGAVNSVAYGLTKAAAINLAKGLALELADDRIRVNALCPGATDTTATDDWVDDSPAAQQRRSELAARHPLGRYSSTEEQARAALFLVSDDASFVTGHALLADGGYTAQ
jgi:NAD(P)-dependent dehydrogenase (short-subunit alcohol dehydrogenase family)